MDVIPSPLVKSFAGDTGGAGSTDGFVGSGATGDLASSVVPAFSAFASVPLGTGVVVSVPTPAVQAFSFGSTGASFSGTGFPGGVTSFADSPGADISATFAAGLVDSDLESVLSVSPAGCGEVDALPVDSDIPSIGAAGDRASPAGFVCASSE